MGVGRKRLVVLIGVLAVMGAMLLGWLEHSSTAAQVFSATVWVTVSAALLAMVAYRVVVRRVALNQVYPLGLVAVAALLEGLSESSGMRIERIIAITLVAFGALLDLRNRRSAA